MSHDDEAPLLNGHTTGVTNEATAPDRGPLPPRKGFIRRHKALTVMLSLFAILGVLAIGAIFYVNDKLGQIDRVPITLPETGRPPKASNNALNILLAGVDNGNGFSLAQTVAGDSWAPGQHRSDTIMILHIDANRNNAYLVSIPRDSYVQIYDDQGQSAGMHKINAAFSYYGPSGYISTVEHLTGLRMEHLAMIDWNGFRDLTDALGGVQLFVPDTVYDNGRVTWDRGFHYMYGEEALRYVRTRHGLAGGDFDRIKRQQNFLRSLLHELTTQGIFTDFLKLNHAINAVTQNLTVDEDWTGGQLRSLALSMRDLRVSDLTFMTAPLASNWNHYIDGEGDVVYLDKGQCAQMWQAIAQDRMAEYAATHENDQLPNSKHVN